MEIRDIPADIKALQVGDWVAFPWTYYGGPWSTDDNKEIQVAQISAVGKEEFCVSFLYGYKSVQEDVEPGDIIAIGSRSGKEQIKLWKSFYGFHILQPNHPVFLKHQEEYKDR